MGGHIVSCSKKTVVCAGFGVFALALTASASPQRIDVPNTWIDKKGMSADGADGAKAIIWLDEAARARGGAASVGSADALIFHQPNDSGFGYFEKSYDDGPLWYCRMGFGNGWVPGDSISSYELRIFHSSSDDIDFGPADYAVELWDGDPLSLTETVCATGGVSAPIPGTQGIIAGVPYATLVTGRVELPAKVVYDCDRVWMVMKSLNGCRAAWRISGDGIGTFNRSPEVGFGNGHGLLTGCESSVFGGACETDTGYDRGFCCGSQGTCSGSGAACGFAWGDCPAGETCDGAEACDHSARDGTGAFVDPCSTGAFARDTFCGDGSTDLFFADVDLPDTESGYVGSIFAATDTTMTVVPVSVDAIPDNYDPGSAPADLITLGGDEIVLSAGGHDVWLEIMIGDWDPDDTGETLCGYLPHLDAVAGFASGVQGTLTRHAGPDPCGECDDDSAPCFNHADCTFGVCSGSASPCHLVSECPSGESCVGAARCDETATGDDVCAAELGAGSRCGPPGYDLGSGTCSWTYTDGSDARWALRTAGATLPGTDLCCTDARPGYYVVFGCPDDPEPFPSGGMYGATLAVHVPADAKGTFTIGLKPFPLSALSSGAGPPIPLLGTVAGFITIQTGSCCYNLTTGESGCLDGNQTAGSCAQLDGVTVFTPNGSCPQEGEICACDPNILLTYDDFNACTYDTCINGVPTHVVKDCDDGLACTLDDCNPNDPTGVGCFATPVNIDDGLACTNDACSEPTGVTHRPVIVDDGDDCTYDYCVEPTADIIHEDVSTVPNAHLCPTGDPVADGCPGATSNPPVSTDCADGFCHCVQCFSGETCSTPECTTPDTPLPELVPSGTGTLVTSAKNRFISFGEAFDVCAPLKAARVTFVSLPRPFDLWDGIQMWVTNPVETSNKSANISPVDGTSNFYGATLTCSGPVFASYGCMETVHVFHEAIVPGGVYRVEFLSEFCSPDFPEDFSTPLEIVNADFGDVVGVSVSRPASAPDGYIDVIDFLAILGGFSNIPGAIIKARADMEPGCLDLFINIADVLFSISGFQGLSYPFVPTADDPCASTCLNPLP